MHKSKLRRITLAVYFALMPVAADAAGLGKLTVISGLGEPLNAEIELLSTTSEELSTLTAGIAPDEAYAVQGLERSALHNAIQVEVSKKPDGTPILKLSTRQPVSDPFLDMLIQVDWATGRLLREYTVLLDPPGYTNNTAGGAAVRAPSVQAQNTDVTGPDPVPDTGEPAAEPTTGTASATTQVQDNTQQDYTTVKGDTLGSIARRLQLEGVSLEQMLAGLYNANQDAFIGGNMNRLRTGQIIRVPSPEELQSITQADAAQQVRVHSTDWNAYRNRLAGIVADSAPGAEDTNAQTSGGRINAAAEDQAAPPASGPRDVVKLSQADPNAAGGNTKEMQDRINALQEEVIAKEKAAQEANERTAMLEKQIADMQKLLAIKSQSLAEMQKNASGATAAPSDQSQPTPPTPLSETPAEAQNLEQSQPAPLPQTPAAETPQVAEQTPVGDKSEKKITPPPPPPIEEPGILDGLTEDPMLLAAAGGGLVLLGGGWLFLRNRRRRNLDSFEQGILTAGGLKANTVFGNTAGGTVDTGDTSFLTDFSQTTGGMIDTHDVDPIAEAEVYMAYGRDAQAEEILKDAIAKEPQRYELHLKLLEIIANRKDSAAFETIAGELYSTLGSNNPIWQKVAQLGQQVEPGNPLYDTTGLNTATAAAVATGAAASAVAAERSRLDISDFDNAEEMSEASLDFSLGRATSMQPSTETAPASSTSAVNADLNAAPGETERPLSEFTTMSDSIFGMTQEPQAAAQQTSNEIDFDLGNAQSVASPAPVESSTLDFGSTMPGLDLPELKQPEDNIQPFKLGADPQSSTSQNALSEDMGLRFEMPDLGATDQPSQQSLSSTGELQSFDQTVFLDLPEAGSDTETRFNSVPQDAPSFDLPESGVSAQPQQEVSPQSVSDGLDFNFDTHFDSSSNGSSMDVSFEAPEDEVPNPPEIDLSGITLDFGPTIDNPEAGTGSLSSGLNDNNMALGESAEVDTKLDLVTAYMEMGDKEGARELLDEVLKEGGPQQKARAQEMLSTIG